MHQCQFNMKRIIEAMRTFASGYRGTSYNEQAAKRLPVVTTHNSVHTRRTLQQGCAVGKKRLHKKLWFSVRFQTFSFTKLTAIFFPVRFLHSPVNAIFHLYLYGMTLKITYFCAELVQLTVSRRDCEVQNQKYRDTA